MHSRGSEELYQCCPSPKAKNLGGDLAGDLSHRGKGEQWVSTWLLQLCGMLLDSFLSRSTQRTEARTRWLGKGSILGKRKIRILKGIKGTLLAHCTQDFNRKLDHKPLRELHWKILPLGPWALPKLWVLNPHFPHSVAGSMCAPPSAEVNRVFSEKQATVLGRGKNTYLSYSATFWKTKERFPANSLAICKNQRGHKS